MVEKKAHTHCLFLNKDLSIKIILTICIQFLRIIPHPKTGKCYISILFYTYSLPCFNELYDFFYVSGLRATQKKVVPAEPINIFDLLTSVSLSYWIADDGSWNKVGKYVTLCTDSFTLVW